MPLISMPTPNDAALAQSQAISAIIQGEIERTHHALSFARYMTLALYTPKLGYYESPTFALGKQGDFFTAPTLTPLFAACIGVQAMQVFEITGIANFLELGPGNGQFAADLIDYLTTTQSLPTQYFLYEVSAHLKAQQQQFLQQKHPDYFHRFVWLDHLPAQFDGVIFGNEVLDAIPPHRFTLMNHTIHEQQVTVNKQQFGWSHGEANDALLNAVSIIQSSTQLSEGYTSEVNLAVAPFIKQLTQSLRLGLLLIADYGYGRSLYYHPNRFEGTLTCFYRHLKHANPFLWPGLQDITAHVDFTSVALAAFDASGHVAGFTTQAHFLLSAGLMQIAEHRAAKLDAVDGVMQNQAIKTLTLPTEMGEVIKLMAITKNIDRPLIGFKWQDRRHELG